MSLISRYVFREVLASVLVVLLVLFVILMSNQFAEILGDAAADELPREAVFAVFRLNSLWYLTALLPISLFLGVMLALARFNRDSETAALFACGIGPGRLLGPVAVLAVLLAGASAWLALVKSPEASLRIEQIRQEAEAELDTNVLEPGRFASPDSGDSVFHAEKVDGDEIENVFWQRNENDSVIVVLARRGKRVQDPNTGQMFFELYDGRAYEGRPGELGWHEIEFSKQTIPIHEDADPDFVMSARMKPFYALLHSTNALDVAELQSRISTPLSILLLALLAVPLSRSSPREGRFARLGVGLLIYLVYSNLQSLARAWIERGEVAGWLGIWWVHVGLACIVLIIYGYGSGWFARPRRIGRSVPA